MYVSTSSVKGIMKIIADFPKRPGVYSITNKVNGCVYIGSSVDIYTRRCHHLSDLRHGRHRNQHLQRSWNKYGEDSFEFAVLKLCEKHELKRWEDQLIADNPNRYNVHDQSYSTYGYHHTEQAKQRIGKASSSRVRRGWTSIECMLQSLRLRGKTYPNREQQIAKITSKTKGRKRPSESIERYRQSKLGNTHGAKDWTIISPDGHTFRVHNLKEFCIAHQIHYNHLREIGHTKGWKLA
jgi:group I intron endonuclease